MDAVRVLPAVPRFQPLSADTDHGAWAKTGSGETWSDEDDRLPPGIAYPIILLFSVSGWALIVTVGLWLYRVFG